MTKSQHRYPCHTHFNTDRHLSLVKRLIGTEASTNRIGCAKAPRMRFTESDLLATPHSRHRFILRIKCAALLLLHST